MTVATGFDGNYLGGTLNDNLNFTQDKSDSKIIKELGDLPPPDQNNEIILDKDNYGRWQFAAEIVLPENITILTKNVEIIGLNPNAGIFGNAPNKPLLRSVGPSSSEYMRNMRLQNIGLNGSIFRARLPSVSITDKFILDNCDIITSDFLGEISGFGVVYINNVRVYNAINGGFVFGGLNFFIPRHITINNLMFLDEPISVGDCLTFDASFSGLDPYNSQRIDISGCQLYAPSGYNKIKVINKPKIRTVNLINTEFLGDGKNLDGFQVNSEGVQFVEETYWAIYYDTATQVTPINVPWGVWTKLTNNKATSDVNLPLRVPSLWDSVANKIDLTGCEIGEMLRVSVVVDIESDKIQTTFKSRLLGLDTAATVVIGKTEFMNQININYPVGLYFDLPITTQDQIDNGFEIQINPSDPNNSTLTAIVKTMTIKKA